MKDREEHFLVALIGDIHNFDDQDNNHVSIRDDGSLEFKATGLKKDSYTSSDDSALREVPAKLLRPRGKLTGHLAKRVYEDHFGYGP